VLAACKAVQPEQRPSQTLQLLAKRCLALLQAPSNACGMQVDEINREMADVFGVAFTPEGTCLGPTSEAAAEGMLLSPSGWDSPSAAFSPDVSNPVGPQHQLRQQPPTGAAADEAQQQWSQQMPSTTAAVLQELRQHTQQLQAQVQQLQALLEQQGGAMSAADGNTSMAAAASTHLGSTASDWQQPTAAAVPASVGSAGPTHHHQHQQQQQQLSHVDGSGRASMVDVAAKPSSGRVAAASCRVLLGEAAFRAVAANAIAKGDVLRVAQLAGIQGAKATAQLIPLCHNILISSVNVDLQLDESSHAVDIAATARAVGQTGVEMEALTGAAVAALTVYDMTKAVSKGIRITELQLEYKEGGKSGVWRRQEVPA
jgi:cyclic pyranopterin phosphate synthase